MKNFKSFTVIEIIIVLIISGVIIGLSLNIFLNFEKLFNNILLDSKKYSDIMYFNNRIKSDFDKAKTITLENNDLIIHKGNKSIVRYNIGGDYLIVIANNEWDTLKLKIENYSIGYLNEDSRLISSFSMMLTYKENPFSMYFKKEYSRRVLFMNELINENERNY